MKSTTLRPKKIMSTAGKLKAAKRRLHQQKMREQEQEALARRKEREPIQTFARTKRTKKVEQQYTAGKMPDLSFRDAVPVSHVDDRWTMAKAKPTPKLSDEMAEREQKAISHYRTNIQTRIGPVYNKGGDQYLIDADLEEVRRGGLRRRS